jgi:ComF family protein
MVYNWLNYIQHLLYPPTCLLCDRPVPEGPALCPGCRSELPRNLNPCYRCALPLPEDAPYGTLCGKCQQQPPPFERCLAPFTYRTPLPELINGLKFRGRLSYSRLLAGLLLPAIEQELRDPPELIIPVPLHPGRLRERGYNQALELARPLSRRLGIPLELHHCRRTRATPPQSGLKQKQRRRNIRGAFEISPRFAAGHVALVDDVVTTGSTVAEFARQLHRRGVQRVEVWALARTP